MAAGQQVKRGGLAVAEGAEVVEEGATGVEEEDLEIKAKVGLHQD